MSFRESRAEEDMEDFLRVWIRTHRARRVIKLYGQNDQRTDEWHAKRSEMITASEVSGAWGTAAARRTLILRKLVPRESGSGSAPALIWGTRLEPVAKEIYEVETGCKITDVSCVQHPVYPFLGASPDGILTSTTDPFRRYRLVEFKCPYSRVAKNEIPEAYIHQMQMQMECTGIDGCEYVEFRFKQVWFAEWMKFSGKRGVFAVKGEKVFYKGLDEDLQTWRSCLAGDQDDYQFVYWILDSQKRDFVAYDPNWLPSHLPDLKSCWDEVLAHRASGSVPESPKSTVVTLEL